MMYSMISMVPFVLLVTLAPNQIALLIGQLLCGFPWGVFAALAPAYSVSLRVCPC
jgi:SP family general alpha glucoside:H+ symporter-like MFS transporter